jgi:hypothetical protein
MSLPYEWSNRQFLQSENGFQEFFERELTLPSPKIHDVYNRLYVIFLLYKRPELQHFLAGTYAEAALSLMFDSYTALRTTQITASILTLRASLDQLLKSWCISMKLEPDPTRFKQNRLKVTKAIFTTIPSNHTILRSRFQSASDSLQSQYEDASRITHHLSVTNHTTNGYLFDSLHHSTNDLEQAVTFIQKVLEDILIITITLCRSSLAIWDTPELREILSLTFHSKKADKIIRLCKL